MYSYILQNPSLLAYRYKRSSKFLTQNKCAAGGGGANSARQDGTCALQGGTRIEYWNMGPRKFFKHHVYQDVRPSVK